MAVFNYCKNANKTAIFYAKEESLTVNLKSRLSEIFGSSNEKSCEKYFFKSHLFKVNEFIHIFFIILGKNF